MGGNALKHVKVRRINLPEYLSLRQEIIDLAAPYLLLTTPLNLADKTSFGDIDFIYTNSDLTIDDIKSIFKPTEIVKNGHIISFDYKLVQIDFIFTPLQYLEFTQFFLSYGDLGRILGSICSHFKFSIGSAGIWINLHTIAHQFLPKYTELPAEYGCNDLHLTSSVPEFCCFMGLDYSKYYTGFASIIELFDWIKSSKYFTPLAFSNKPKDPSRIRPSYTAWLDYIAIPDYKPDYNSAIDPSIKTFYEYTIDYFDKWQQLDDIILTHQIYLENKQKFNSEILISLGFHGPNLKHAFIQFKKYIAETYIWPFNIYLQIYTAEHIQGDIRIALNLQ